MNKDISLLKTDTNLQEKVELIKNQDSMPFEIAVTQLHPNEYIPSLYLRTRKYREFQDYLLYISKSDFYDLNFNLRELIKRNEEGLAINISLDEKQIRLSQIQNIIEKVFIDNKTKSASDLHLNESLLSNIYDLMDMLIQYDDGDTLIVIEDDPFRIEFVSYDGRLKGTFRLRY